MKNLLRAFGIVAMSYAAVIVANAKVILPPDINYTALHKSADNCDINKAREALKAIPASRVGEEINRLDREGDTPLGYAARAGCLDVVALLVGKGASVDARHENFGWTPLLYAAAQRHAAVVRYLLDHGANPNVKTRIGKTPLSVALAGTIFSRGPAGDRDATVKALLEKRADASAMLAAYDELNDLARKQQSHISNLEEANRRLEDERRRLNEIIDKIRSHAGNTEPGPY